MVLTAVLVSPLVSAKNGAGFAGGVTGIVFLLHGLTGDLRCAFITAAAKIVHRQDPGFVTGIGIGIGITALIPGGADKSAEYVAEQIFFGSNDSVIESYSKNNNPDQILDAEHAAWLYVQSSPIKSKNPELDTKFLTSSIYYQTEKKTP